MIWRETRAEDLPACLAIDPRISAMKSPAKSGRSKPGRG